MLTSQFSHNSFQSIEIKRMPPSNIDLEKKAQMGYVYNGKWKKPIKRHIKSRAGDIIEMPPPSMASLITANPSIP